MSEVTGEELLEILKIESQKSKVFILDFIANTERCGISDNIFMKNKYDTIGSIIYIFTAMIINKMAQLFKESETSGVSEENFNEIFEKEFIEILGKIKDTYLMMKTEKSEVH